MMHQDVMRWKEETIQDDFIVPTVKNHSVSYFNNYLYCFGGYDGRRNHMTLLIYSIREKRWIRPQYADAANIAHLGDPNFLVKGNPPPGRNGHTATLIAEADEENAKIIIVGGWLGTGPLAASDMHVLDITQGGKRLRWYQPAIKGTPPGPCNMHSADYVPSQREVYVFRGGNGREYLNDLHAVNVDTLTWRHVPTRGDIPQQRANHSSALLEQTNELFIFGGWNGQNRLNDIHILDVKTSCWSCPIVGGMLPRPRAGMTLTALRGRLYLFGGSGTSSQCFQDLQIFDRHQMAWLDVNVESEGEYAPAFFAFGANSNEGFNDQQADGNVQRAVLPGHDDMDVRGLNMQGFNDQMGRFDPPPFYPSANPNDEQSVPSVKIYGSGPSNRAGHTATAVNRKIYIFGGSFGSDYLNDFFCLDTDPAPQVHVDDSSSLALIERRLHQFCNNEQFSDVTFLVEGRRVYGHRMVLSIVSDCFRAMFTTGFREAEALEIEIPDATYSSFIMVMEYIYSGSMPNFDPTNMDSVVGILELADRFILDNLKQHCERILKESVNADTVEYILSVAQKTNALQLLIFCEHFLRN